MPFEMIPAIFMAVMIGGNVPFAVAGVWISNPVTWIPLYTPCYLLGAKIMQLEPIPVDQISMLQLGWHYVALWAGCLIVGTVVSLSTHFLLNLVWALQIRKRWQERRARRAQAKQNR